MPEIFNKPISFIMSFGHCGIDWLHSLLNNHEQILILPLSSFYKLWSTIDDHNDINKIINIIRNHLNSLTDHKGNKLKLFDSLKLDYIKFGVFTNDAGQLTFQVFLIQTLIILGVFQQFQKT